MIEYKNTVQFQKKVTNFPTEVYRIDDKSTHIFKLMYTLLELGLGQLQLWQDEASNSESLPGTKFTDLDALYAFLGIARLPEELYRFDPYHDQLTADEWNEIFTKDSLFRLRIMKFFQALLRGGTLEGVQMMAEAACGAECQVFEMWRVINGRGLAEGTALGRRDAAGNLLLEIAKEFVIVPLEDIDDNQRAAVIHLVDLLKPVNTVSTVHTSPVLPLQEVVVRFSASDGHYFEVRRMVTATSDPIFEGREIWIQPNQEVEAPTFALMDHSDTEFTLNEAVTSIKTFRIDDSFFVQSADLNGGINSSVETLVVTETSEPAAPSFSIKIDSEIIFVTERVPVLGSDTDFTYTVVRAQDGTTAATHSNGADVFLGALTIYGDALPSGATFAAWRPIPLADSPDNFPTGLYAGDPAKYDSEGNYIFDYGSQPEYVAWYTTQVQALSGEVNANNQYRLPLAVEAIGGLATQPEDALAPPEFFIQSRIYPEVR